MLMFGVQMVFGQSNLIVSSDFEKGTQKWERRGSVSIRTTDKEAAGGKKSLHVKGRTEFWQGAQLNVTNLVSSGKSYRFTVSVKLEQGSKPALVKMTMQKGDNLFESVAAAGATDASWTNLSGIFRPGGEPYQLVYIESEDPRAAFYIDDFSIELFDIGAEQKGTLVKTDFQDGTAQNWLIQGEGVQVFSGMIGSNFVVKVDGRKESWHGLAYDVTSVFYPERKYRLSISAMIGGGPPTDTIKLRVRRTTPEGKVSFDDVASADGVNSALWTKLEGEYTVPGNGTYLVIVEAGKPETSFFLDDFELSVP